MSFLESQIQLINQTSDVFTEAFETVIMDGENKKVKNPRFTAVACSLVAIIKQMQHLSQEERHTILLSFVNGVSRNELDWLKLTGRLKP